MQGTKDREREMGGGGPRDVSNARCKVPHQSIHPGGPYLEDLQPLKVHT